VPLDRVITNIATGAAKSDFPSCAAMIVVEGLEVVGCPWKHEVGVRANSTLVVLTDEVQILPSEVLRLVVCETVVEHSSYARLSHVTLRLKEFPEATAGLEDHSSLLRLGRLAQIDGARVGSAAFRRLRSLGLSDGGSKDSESSSMESSESTASDFTDADTDLARVSVKSRSWLVSDGNLRSYSQRMTEDVSSSESESDSLLKASEVGCGSGSGGASSEESKPSFP
jgi:hypothetical protein